MKLQGLDSVFKNLGKVKTKTVQNIVIGYGLSAAKMQNEAKQNAPWTDRTGNARASIQAQGPQYDKDVVRFYLTIMVFYGRYLELSRGGRYAIIWPTVESNRMDVIKNIRGALSL